MPSVAEDLGSGGGEIVEGLLDLDGLKDISDTAAQHLAKHSWLTITLDNLPATGRPRTNLCQSLN